MSSPLTADDGARAWLAAIVDSSDDAIISKTLEGIITSWNRSAERIFGYTNSEAIGQSILLIIPAERRSEETDVLTKIRRGEKVDHFETVRRRKDGSLVDISLTVSPIRDGQGRIVGASKIARDISERRRLEQERDVLLAESQSRNRAKDEFLAMLSHELRNPLGAITNAIHLLEIPTSDGESTSLAHEVIARQARQLTKIVDDLLDVARVTGGKIQLERRPLDLANAVHRHFETLRASDRTASHSVRLETRSVWVDADPVRLEQIVANLVGNALKYTKRGGSIRVGVRQDGAVAVLEVEDNGAGIAPEMQPHVFELFMQGPRPLDRSPGGLGIGLALVKSLAELHGGSVEVASPGLGRGSCFTLRLPAIPPPAQTRRLASRAHSAKHVRPRRVLVVEDDADAREMLCRIIQSEGHEVFEAHTGPEGVDAVLRLSPDVALIDIGLPELDGYRVAERIHEQAKGSRPLLVALTGYGLVEDRNRSTEAGFDMHFVKPIDPEQLAKILEQVPQP